MKELYANRISRPIVRRVAAAMEWLVWGGTGRERMYLSLLKGHYRSRFRRDWKYPREKPHFFRKRLTWFFCGFTDEAVSPRALLPGFLNSLILSEGDKVLDIGCGDGFYASHFYARTGALVDAIDHDRDALQEARRWGRTVNVEFTLADAERDPFPSPVYDVITWDGGIGHVSGQQSSGILQKIAHGLSLNGVFAGSESLGEEGHDHLQFFNSLEDLARLFRPHFKFVELREESYHTLTPGQFRREGYWRCSNGTDRLRGHDWRSFGEVIR
jgi:SAM-dependent methyltransferase